MDHLSEISKTENELVSNALGKYGEYYEHARFAHDFCRQFIKSTDYEAVFFLMFFSVFEKHVALSILSALRLHHTQSVLNLRTSAEATAWSLYALGHPNPELYAETTERGTLEPTKALKGKMYKWLEDNYPDGSASLKQFKNSTNSLSTHANIVDAHRNFGDFKKDKITTYFFDNEEEHMVKTDLWASANMVMGALDFVYGVNKDYKHIVLVDDFLQKMEILKHNNNYLKEQMLKHPRFARLQTEK